jgi:two-component system, NarL family, nitrate/nitrite response regulator NarL
MENPDAGARFPPDIAAWVAATSMQTRSTPIESRDAIRDLQIAEKSSRASLRLLIVTAVRLYRDGLARLLAERAECISVDPGAPRDQLSARLASFDAAAVLVDVTELRNDDLMAALRSTMPNARLVAFAVADDTRDILSCAQAGVAAFVGCDASIDDLLIAVEGVRRGELRCSPRLAALAFGRLSEMTHGNVLSGPALTPRQRQILALLDQGLSNKEIARALRITVPTVKNHVHNLLGRLKVRHRWQVAGVGTRALAPR